MLWLGEAVNGFVEEYVPWLDGVLYILIVAEMDAEFVVEWLEDNEELVVTV